MNDEKSTEGKAFFTLAVKIQLKLTWFGAKVFKIHMYSHVHED